MQLRFLQRGGILAVFFAVLQPVDAPPDIFLGTVALDPLGAAVHTAAFAADQPLRQSELAGAGCVFRRNRRGRQRNVRVLYRRIPA